MTTLSRDDSKAPVRKAPVHAEALVKSKQRVADHGEVFTPSWLVNDMLDLVQHETERIESRFLEPACGAGNFLLPVLERKLRAVKRKYGRSDFEKHHFALLALMSIYGVELLADNVQECRANLLVIFERFLKVERGGKWARAAEVVATANIVHGDAMTMTAPGDEAAPIIFAEWGYLGKGRYQRRDFRYDTLTQMSSFGEDTLFGHSDMAKHEIFVPVQSYPPLSVEDLANG